MSSDSVLDAIVSAAEYVCLDSTTLGCRVRVWFAFPVPSGGVTAQGMVSSKLFYVIDINRSDKSLCFGIIGHGSSFFIIKNCSTKSHLVSKMSLTGSDESFIFIRRPIACTVFSEPRLPSFKIPEEVMNDWKFKMLTFDNWTTEFQAVDGTNKPLATAEY